MGRTLANESGTIAVILATHRPHEQHHQQCHPRHLLHPQLSGSQHHHLHIQVTICCSLTRSDHCQQEGRAPGHDSLVQRGRSRGRRVKQPPRDSKTPPRALTASRPAPTERLGTVTTGKAATPGTPPHHRGAPPKQKAPCWPGRGQAAVGAEWPLLEKPSTHQPETKVPPGVCTPGRRARTRAHATPALTFVLRAAILGLGSSTSVPRVQGHTPWHTQGRRRA